MELTNSWLEGLNKSLEASSAALIPGSYEIDRPICKESFRG